MSIDLAVEIGSKVFVRKYRSTFIVHNLYGDRLATIKSSTLKDGEYIYKGGLDFQPVGIFGGFKKGDIICFKCDRFNYPALYVVKSNADESGQSIEVYELGFTESNRGFNIYPHHVYEGKVTKVGRIKDES